MLTPARVAMALVLKPRMPCDSKMRALASRMTFTVSFDLAWPGVLRDFSVFLRGLPRPSRTRVLFASICSYCRARGNNMKGKRTTSETGIRLFDISLGRRGRVYGWGIEN